MTRSTFGSTPIAARREKRGILVISTITERNRMRFEKPA
jgi:hypothetical protein